MATIPIAKKANDSTAGIDDPILDSETPKYRAEERLSTVSQAEVGEIDQINRIVSVVSKGEVVPEVLVNGSWEREYDNDDSEEER